MCEREFVACGGCDVPASELSWRETRYEYAVYGVDEDGEVDFDDADYEPGDTVDDGRFYCRHCGWEGTNLDACCVPDDCDCAECEPPDPTDEDTDPNEIVMLRRSADDINPDIPELQQYPWEIRHLWANRANWCLAVRRQRAAEIWNRYLAEPSERGENLAYIDFESSVPDRAQRDLNERERKAAPQLWD